MKTDVTIHKEVVEELALDPRIDERNIGVAVSDAIVTLTGTVPSYGQKYVIEALVKRIAGVRGIAEELKVDLPQGHQKTDADIAAAALRAMSWNIFVPAQAIQVTVESGHVTLSGNVEWQFQRAEAEASVRTLVGVVGVTNLIAFRAATAPRRVQEKIEHEFELAAEAEARRASKRIVVETNGGRVILKGLVHSFRQRDEAARAAWSVPGVTKVENLLTID